MQLWWLFISKLWKQNFFIILDISKHLTNYFFIFWYIIIVDISCAEWNIITLLHLNTLSGPWGICSLLTCSNLSGVYLNLQTCVLEKTVSRHNMASESIFCKFRARVLHFSSGRISFLTSWWIRGLSSF